MPLNSRLPNDLLHNPPWPETILSGPMDEVITGMTRTLEDSLRDRGYEIKYGIEVNLQILSPEEAAKELNQRHSPILNYWRRASRVQFRQALAAADMDTAWPAAAAETYAQLEALARQHERHPVSYSREWLTNWQLLQAYHREATGSGPADKVLLARKDFVIGAVHLLPQHLGGLHGVIEQRFLSGHYGYGWWDGNNMPELRTIPVTGFEAGIARYHETLWRLKNAAEHFGFVPVAARVLAQPHASLWRIKDNKNIMAVDDEESLALRGKIAKLLYNMFDLLPIGHFSRFIDLNPIEAAPFVGSSRVSTVRTCDDNWELRLPHPNGVTHIARDLLYFTDAVHRAVNPEATAPGEHEDRKKWDVILAVALGDNSSRPHRSVERVRRITVDAAPARVACPFMSCLEGAALNEDGELLVPRDVIEWNGRSLIKAIGWDAIDLFSVKAGEDIYNLNVLAAWQELFKRIRIRDDGAFDTSRLQPALAAHFDGLKVRSIRTDIHMPEANGHVPFEQRFYHDIVKAHFFAEGPLTAMMEALRPGERELMRFIRDRNLVFDPEEAAAYLRGFYYSARKEFRSAPATATRKAVSRFIGSGLQDLLMGGMRYRNAGLDEKVLPFFEDHDLLKAAMSQRENVLGALPEIARVDAPNSERFSARFGAYLHDPAKLYAFDNTLEMIGGLTQTTVNIMVNLAKSIPVLEEVLTADLPQEDVAMVSQSMFNYGLPVGKTVLRVAAGMQATDTATSAIIRQYAEQASTLTARGRPADPTGYLELPGLRQETVRFMETAFLEGVASGMAEEAQSLMADPSPLTVLREKARAGLQPA